MELAESGGYQAVGFSYEGFSYDQPSATATSDAPSGEWEMPAAHLYISVG